MKKLPGVLIIDDNEDVLLAAKLLLKPYTGMICTEKDPEKIPGILKNGTYDVIFLDMNFKSDVMSGQEGFYWLNEILKLDPAAVVILITAYGDIEMAVKAVKEGATDFVLKPWQNEKFLTTFSAALKLRESKLELENLRSRQQQLSEDLDHGYQDFVGISEGMKRVNSTILKVAATDANVLILGENGTGKELAARALHRNSNRSKNVFISVDLGSITPSLFESELFGHVKGSFTDAREDRAGRFEVASGGTLFLDEIANIPVELQAKLLTVLQNREITRVGSNKTKPVDIRLICATNMPVQQMVSEKKFRPDLLYRINTVEIDLPPLRERKEDIPLLAEHFLTMYKKKYHKPVLSFDPAAMRKLEHYNWPGNIRELQHAVERAVILSDTEVLHLSDFYFNQSGSTESLNFDDYNLDEVEKTIIRKVLNKHEGNVSKAARELGITRTSLYRRMEKYGL